MAGSRDSPARRRARVARPKSSAMAASTNAAAANASTASDERTPRTNAAAAATTPSTTGHRKFRLRLSSEPSEVSTFSVTPWRARIWR